MTRLIPPESVVKLLSICTVNTTNKNGSLPIYSIQGSAKDDEIGIEYDISIVDPLLPSPSG